VSEKNICEPSRLKLLYISQFYAILSVNVDQLDYEGEQDFLAVGKPYWSSFPLLLGNYLNNVVRQKLPICMIPNHPQPLPKGIGHSVFETPPLSMVDRTDHFQIGSALKPRRSSR
jgi:hypothetical protein